MRVRTRARIAQGCRLEYAAREDVCEEKLAVPADNVATSWKDNAHPIIGMSGPAKINVGQHLVGPSPATWLAVGGVCIRFAMRPLKTPQRCLGSDEEPAEAAGGVGLDFRRATRRHRAFHLHLIIFRTSC